MLPGSNRYSRNPIESDTVRRMRASPGEYLRLDLRAHDLLREVPLYDVSIVDLQGGGAGRSVADIRALESAAAPSRVANTTYGLRRFLGRVFGWDRMQMPPGRLAAVAAV
jgi:hypothetical protein